ncbi:MAG: branched-chain amino acid ABC transporter permease [Clostridia bacterium]|nr:branched-chain amino acid ABC transporter permease [Clostridia bacterium]
MKKNKIAQGYLLNTAAIAVAIIVFSVVKSAYGDSAGFKLIFASCVWQCCYLILLAASLNLVIGFLGQLSLGHCGFMAIGAYAAALISLAFQRTGVYTDKSGFVFVLVLIGCILIAGVLAAIVGLLVGIPALRLKGDYLAIITLGFGMIIVNIINNLPFAGQNGLAEGSASASLYKNGLGFGTASKVTFIWIAIFTTLVCLAMMFMFVRSKYGRAIRAIRDDSIAAEASGINTSYYKALTFAYSAFFAGVAGALYACANATLSTSSFAFSNGGILNSTFVVVMVVLGGMGSLTGSIFAAVLMFVINYQIKNGAWVAALPAAVGSMFDYPMLVYALVLIIFILFRPKGIFGSYEFSLRNSWGDIRRGLKKRTAASAEKKEVKSNG